MPSSGSLILATDYNNIQTTISNILGTGSGQLGYGQTVTSQQVAIGNLISGQASPTAYQWISLYNDMLKIANHQGTDITALTAAFTTYVGPGKTVRATDVSLFSTTASTLQTNAMNVASGQYSTEAFSPDISNQRSTSWGSSTKTTIQHSFTVTFASANAARYFFNSGGQIQLSASIAGYTGVQSTNWFTLLSTMGTIAFGATSTTAGSGTPTASFGYYSLTATAQQMFTKAGTSYNGVSTFYTANDYTVNAKTASGGAQVLIDIYFNDDAKNTANYDSVNGTITSTIQIRRASGANVSITAPTAANTTLLSA